VPPGSASTPRPVAAPCRHVEEDTAGDDRGHALDAQMFQPAEPLLRVLRVDVPVQPSVLGDMAQRVHVGARMSAQHHQLVRPAAVARQLDVAVANHQREEKGWVRGVTRHSAEQRLSEVVDASLLNRRAEMVCQHGGPPVSASVAVKQPY